MSNRRAAPDSRDWSTAQDLRPSSDLTGKVALVTGAARGIGAAIAARLRVQGATVVGGDLRFAADGDDPSQAPAEHGLAAQIALDVRSLASIDGALAWITSNVGELEILVNNAAVVSAPGRESSAEDDESDWTATFDVNLLGVVRCCEIVAPQMQDHQSGKIVNIASIAGHSPFARLSYYDVRAYDVSKAAVLRFTSGLASKLARYNINVNAVCPGVVWTDPAREYYTLLASTEAACKGKEPYDVFAEDCRRFTPLGRPQSPEDIAAAVAFLVSDDARNITGQCLHVDGGAIMGAG